MRNVNTIRKKKRLYLEKSIVKKAEFISTMDFNGYKYWLEKIFNNWFNFQASPVCFSSLTPGKVIDS